MSRVVPSWSERFCVALIWLTLGQLAWNFPRLAQAQPATSTLIARLDRAALSARLNSKAVPQVQRDGLRFVLPTREGLSGFFGIGVWERVESAQTQWNAFAAPVGATPVTLTAAQKEASDELRVWKLPNEESFQFASRRLNVVSHFIWRGEMDPGLAWLREFNATLTTDALQGTPQADVEVLVPAVWPANQPMPVLWRAQDNLVALAPQIETSVPIQKQVTAENVSSAMAPRAGTEISLPPGVYTLDLRLVTSKGLVLQREVATRILPVSAIFPAKVTKWALPEKSLYFWSGEAPIWNDASPENREQLQLSGAKFESLADSAQTTWARLRAWNEMAKVLRPEWLPELEMVQVFRVREGTRESLQVRVAYEHGERRLIWIAELGQNAQLYIESAGALPKNSSLLSELLLPEIVTASRNGNSAWKRVGLFAKTLRRKRAFSASSGAAVVEIAWIHLAQPAAATLRFPGYG